MTTRNIKRSNHRNPLNLEEGPDNPMSGPTTDPSAWKEGQDIEDKLILLIDAEEDLKNYY